MRQIIPGLYLVTGLPVGRVYILEDPDGLSVVDASVPGTAGRILAQIGALGRQPQDVKRILITHAHPDHVGALPDLKRATGAQVIVGALDRPVIEGQTPVVRVAPEKLPGPFKLRPPRTVLKPTPVDLALSGGETLPVLGGLRAIFTPGHSPGHLSFWQPERRVLICGDVLFHLLGITLPLAALTVDMDENKRSVRVITDLRPQVVCFGHGDPLTVDADAQLEAFARKIGV